MDYGVEQSVSIKGYMKTKIDQTNESSLLKTTITTATKGRQQRERELELELENFILQGL